MELRRLKYFVTLADHLHFGRAATALHIAQPALSQQLKVLEREVGAQLVHRSSRQVSLTMAGEVLLQEARTILRHVEVAVDKTQAVGAGKSGRLRIVYTRSAPDLGARELVESFRAQYPLVEVSTLSGWTSHNLALLRQQEVDVAFVRLPLAEAPEFHTAVLGYDDLVIALPAEHRLATRRAISRQALLAEPIVTWPRSQGVGFHDSILADVWHGSQPTVVKEEPDAENILAAVALGLGLAVLDRRRAVRLKPLGVVIRRFSGEPARAAFGIAWLSDTTPVAQSFVSMCMDSSSQTPHWA